MSGRPVGSRLTPKGMSTKHSGVMEGLLSRGAARSHVIPPRTFPPELSRRFSILRLELPAEAAGPFLVASSCHERFSIRCLVPWTEALAETKLEVTRC